jgi:predicted RNA binding protein YcfA (HicA-like mRNA interferase family)
MPKMRTLSGPEVITIFGEFGFSPVSRLGSRMKLRGVLDDGSTQTLTVPNHNEIDRGTLQAIFRQASRFISESELRRVSLRTEHQRRPESPMRTPLPVTLVIYLGERRYQNLQCPTIQRRGCSLHLPILELASQ